jgi:hypothetical protein
MDCGPTTAQPLNPSADSSTSIVAVIVLVLIMAVLLAFIITVLFRNCYQ